MWDQEWNFHSLKKFLNLSIDQEQANNWRTATIGKKAEITNRGYTHPFEKTANWHTYH